MATALFIDYVQLFEMGNTGLPANFSQFVKTPLAALKNILFGSPFLLEKVPIRSPFHSKMDPHFYKFRNPLHVGAVHDALDNIGLFQSVCGQFKLIKVLLFS